MGSREFLDFIKEQGTEVEEMIALDMIGYFSEEKKLARLPILVNETLLPKHGELHRSCW